MKITNYCFYSYIFPFAMGLIYFRKIACGRSCDVKLTLVSLIKFLMTLNSGIILSLLLIFVIRADCSYFSSDSQSIQELCSSNRYIYSVRLDEPQQLKLTYNTTARDINKWYQKSKRKCRKEFKTNNGAYHFVVTVSNMSIPSCSKKCLCNYFEISEPGYTEKFCGEHDGAIYFESKGDYLSIDFQHGLSMQFEVTLIFTIERNAYIITGLPKKDPHHSGHSIETPYFPNTYQSDYTSEYFFHTDAPDGRIMLLFLDFIVSPTSYIEIVGHNGTIPEKFFGNVFRPPVFVSQSTDLTLKFDANNQPGKSGFRALCYFLKAEDVQVVKPFTDCGGLMYGYGGSIILEKRESKLCDCLWHIITPIIPQDKSYFLSVSNISLTDVGPKASLEFREGLNSISKVVKTVDCTNSNCNEIPIEITVSAYSGLYIRFRGDLNQFSFIGMVYSTYHNGNCSSARTNCQGRCLPSNLVCDGLKHCPDGSDELECTKTTVIEPAVPTVGNRKSKSSRAVVGFNIILSVGVCGFLAVVVVTLIIFYKHVKMPPPVLQSEQPEIVSELSGPLPRAHSVGPLVDYLPSYEDFIQASDRYPPLLYTRAEKRLSVPQTACNILHTTSFCGKSESRANSTTDTNSHTISFESIFTDGNISLTEPSCSYGRSPVDWTVNKPEMKRVWSSDSKLDEMNKSDCHLHLSIKPCCQCQNKQYCSLPINFKISSCKDNNISIIFKKNHFPSSNLQRNRHLSFNCSTSPKILMIKTRCQSEPCHFSVHYSV